MTHADKTQEDESESVANAVLQGKRNEPASQVIANGPGAIAQRKLEEMANNSPQALQLKAIGDLANSSPGSVTQFVLTDEEVAEWVDSPAEDIEWMDEGEKAQVGRLKATRAAKKKEDEEWEAALESRVTGTKCVSWDYGGKNYHINLGLGVYHVTVEASPKIHYFFEGFGADIKDKPSGNGGKHDKLFSALPANVQKFIKENFAELLV